MRERLNINIMAAAVMACLLTSCHAVESSEQIIDYRHMARITQRMDSVIHATTLWQQSVYERQVSLVDSIKHSEVRDTSRTIFLGAKGDTVRETVIIRNIVEREHTSQESTQELRQEMELRTDSLLAVNRTLEAKMDSLLHDREKTTVVEKQTPWYERLTDGVARAVLFVLAGVLIGTVVRRRLVR